jgi:hypothetical protein
MPCTMHPGFEAAACHAPCIPVLKQQHAHAAAMPMQPCPCSSHAHAGCCWQLLLAAGCCWLLLLAAGCCWLLLLLLAAAVQQQEAAASIRLIARLRDTTWGHKAAAPAANFLDLAVESSIISSYSLWLLLSGGGLRVL